MGPVDLRDLLAQLDVELLRLLGGLTIEDWARPTACRLWSVKDVAAHLLDGNAPTASRAARLHRAKGG
jgi:hypothetical protein